MPSPLPSSRASSNTQTKTLPPQPSQRPYIPPFTPTAKQQRSQIPVSAPQQPAQPNPSTTRPSTFDRTALVYRKNRSVVYAVGVAVIAGAGALLGGGLGSWKDARERARLAAIANNTTATDPSTLQTLPPTEKSDETISQRATSAVPPASVTEATTIPQQLSPETTTQQLKTMTQQIEHLESRRGHLMVKKQLAEQKLNVLRERMVVREREKDQTARLLEEQQPQQTAAPTGRFPVPQRERGGGG